MKKTLPFLVLLLIQISVFAQIEQSIDTIVREAKIGYDANGNLISFIPNTPPLQQIAGAPTAFYSYYWEFGDGFYSTDKEPKHHYKKKGDYKVSLWATNNYGTERPPATRPTTLSIRQTAEDVEDTSSMQEDFTIKRNREPMVNEEMVIILSYKNTLNYVASGKIHLFFNESQFKADNFETPEIRTHYGENILDANNTFVLHTQGNDEATFLADRSLYTNPLAYETAQDSTIKTNLPLSLEEAKLKYRDQSVIEFNGISPGEERNIFLSMRTTPEMIKDTSAIISVRGVYVPDSNYGNHKIKDMEMEIVTSHDPNKMSSNGSIMNYRFVRFKRLNYKIKFQNNGEGPARTIRLETDIPEMLDMATLEIEDQYPECPICPKEPVTYSCLDTTFTKNQAIFTYKNIYIPGSEQKNVQEKDSTKGFVKYSIKFAKDFHKKKTKSRTAIIFDKNEPIITNYATTRFLPGISIGVKSGYNYYPDLEDSKSYFIGATISPYKAYRWYLQAEWTSNFNSYSDTNSFDEIVDNSQGTRQLQRTTTVNEQQNVNWEVPVLLRYNINNYIGLGAGIQGNFNFSEKQTTTFTVNLYENDKDDFLMSSTSNTDEFTDSFSNIRKGILFDATFGIARIGPSLGARYVLNFEEDFNYWQFYAIWKF
ncbi:PKD domain-containing protein [Cellulophaga sp. F20128]|uniref:PKD domain-containing protein n=1 Tax=Cellulophaga sp. F20128 TaxID=2926413 RepID=UPI001FF465CA|nr:PKD domain-containing protein [Cellulophaga sp. F20128]MCK0156716.1 PKD domain-containing protein [Cellulophaga sp. F20128]